MCLVVRKGAGVSGSVSGGSQAFWAVWECVWWFAKVLGYLEVCLVVRKGSGVSGSVSGGSEAFSAV